jgi:3-dehydrosphinganine reductase
MVNSKLVQTQPFAGKIAIVTGGSKGIGKATAILIAKLGGSACVIARTPDPLAEAADEIKKNFTNENQFVETLATDTTEMDQLQPQLESFVQEHGVPDYLIQCVGFAYPQYIEKITLEDCRRGMEVDYFGQLVPILCLLPHFLEAKKGHIANVSSTLGFMGLIGYATYTPAKFAIVGLTETLRHELKDRGLSFSILYPPDTNTPGFAIENQSKPPETAEISKRGKLMQPEQVAEAFVEGILHKEFYILPGESKFLWKMMRHFPGLVHSIMDGDLKKARKKVGNT